MKLFPRRVVLDHQPGAIDDRQLLPGKHEGYRTMCTFQRHTPGHCRFIGIGRTDYGEIGDDPQARQLLDGLMRGTVLSHNYRVMREDVRDVQF